MVLPAAVWFGTDTDGEVDKVASSSALAFFGSSSISLLEYDLGDGGECAVFSELSGDSECLGLETGVNAMDLFCGSFLCSGCCGWCCLGAAAMGWFVSVDRMSVDGVGIPYCFNVCTSESVAVISEGCSGRFDTSEVISEGVLIGGPSGSRIRIRIRIRRVVVDIDW